ncbi:mucin-2-like [Cervus canadensis]|uniref:mucin-2-like n=1 Tax=Cervus canadensis TaxID=1574408 RepID=UPI001CA310CA|nr:mucin-2-like [Cervus canadensis]
MSVVRHVCWFPRPSALYARMTAPAPATSPQSTRTRAMAAHLEGLPLQKLKMAPPDLPKALWLLLTHMHTSSPDRKSRPKASRAQIPPIAPEDSPPHSSDSTLPPTTVLTLLPPGQELWRLTLRAFLFKVKDGTPHPPKAFWLPLTHMHTSKASRTQIPRIAPQDSPPPSSDSLTSAAPCPNSPATRTRAIAADLEGLHPQKLKMAPSDPPKALWLPLTHMHSPKASRTQISPIAPQDSPPPSTDSLTPAAHCPNSPATRTRAMATDLEGLRPQKAPPDPPKALWLPLTHMHT